MRSISSGPSLRPYQAAFRRAAAQDWVRPVTGRGGGLSHRSRLSRAHNQLVSQLQATVRAMEMSPDINHRDLDVLIQASRSAGAETDRRQAPRPAPVSPRPAPVSPFVSTPSTPLTP